MDPPRTPEEASDKSPRHLNNNSTPPARDAELITLNIGGQLFITTKDTLLKGDTMLSRMFSGQFKSSCCVDRDGELLKLFFGSCMISFYREGNPFIDRDGKHFRIILNFLRSGKFVPPSDPVSVQELLVEADYYQV